MRHHFYCIYWIILSILVLPSCRSRPSDMLADKNKWMPILSDMYAYQVAIESSDNTIRDSLEALYKHQILEIHQIEEWELEDFMKIMGQYPKEAAELLDQTVKYLDSIELLVKPEGH